MKFHKVAGARKFDVFVEGIAQTNIDPFVMAGNASRSAFVLNFTPTVADGFLTIQTKTLVNNAKVRSMVVAKYQRDVDSATSF
jgi:hypothetical protein